MRKKYLKLTKEQKSRGIIFSSELIEGDLDIKIHEIHEVHEHQENKSETIKRLKEDSFFNESPFDYNLIRQ